LIPLPVAVAAGDTLYLLDVRAVLVLTLKAEVHPAVVAAEGQLEALYQDPDTLQQVPIIPRAKAALDKARMRPVHPRYSEMSTAMAEQFNRCLKAQVNPTQAAQTLQARLSNIV
jgi:hypothetical protein